MGKSMRGRQKGFPGRLGTLLCMWFLAGMPLSMMLSGIYSLVGVPLPPLFFFLSALIYLAGGLLGCMWSRENLRRKGISRADMLIALFIFIMSIGFLLSGIIIAVVGFRRL